MEISFTVEASELNRAFSLVSIVTPQSNAQGGGGGYLFSVRGNQECAIYSRDNSKHEARTSLTITDVQGEGQFMFPAEYISGFQYVDGPIKVTASEIDGAFKVRYQFANSGVSDRVTFDPRDMYDFEQDIQTTKETVEPKVFSIKVLQFALSAARSYLPKSNDQVDQDFYKTIKIFGDADPELAKKANGYMVASNSKEIFYLYCSAFVGKDLTLPQAHLSLIDSFLSRSQGTVSVYNTDNKAYIINGQGDVLGWPRQSAEYTKFQYYAKSEEIVVQVEPDVLIKRLKWAKTQLPKDKYGVRLHFNPETTQFKISVTDANTVSESEPVATKSADVKVTEEVVINVNAQHMVHMLEGIKGEYAELRIKIVPADASNKRTKTRYMFRTIDTFFLTNDGVVVGAAGTGEDEAHECRVTRYAPSID
jgi:hypothetical protein